jgi:hypothetical protein
MISFNIRLLRLRLFYLLFGNNPAKRYFLEIHSFEIAH